MDYNLLDTAHDLWAALAPDRSEGASQRPWYIWRTWKWHADVGLHQRTRSIVQQP